MTPFEVARIVRDVVRYKMPRLHIAERVGWWLGMDPTAVEMDVAA